MVCVRVIVRVNIKVGVSARVKVGIRGLGLSAKPGIPGHSGTQILWIFTESFSLQTCFIHTCRPAAEGAE